MTIQLIFRSLSNISNIVLCIVSLRAFWTKSPGYARIFSLLCWFEELADIATWFAGQHPLLGVFANESVVLAEIFCFGYIFYRVIHSRVVRWITASLLALLLLRCLFLVFKFGISHRLPASFDLFPYVFFLIPCFTYYREIFIFRRNGDLLKDFTFWLVTGITFSCGATIVNLVGLAVLSMLKAGDQHLAFDILFSFMFIISNFLFIKACLCLRK